MGLRVLQVVTALSPDGAYGGPSRVATAQARELKKLGHDVVVAAGAVGFESDLPRTFEGADVKLFRSVRLAPRAGFATNAAPMMLPWLLRHAPEFDVIHVHFARDLTMLPASWIMRQAGVPVVVQPHGMVLPSPRVTAKSIDRLVTIPLLRSARSVMSLVADEDVALRELGGRDLPIRRLHNGVDVSDASEPARRALNGGLEVLFLARLHARKQPVLFANIARAITKRNENVKFSIVGPDGGELGAVQDVLRDISHQRVSVEGPIAPSKVARRMAQSDVYVLTAADEPFGLTVVEAMSQGVPVVVARTCGLASVIESANAGIVVDGSQVGFEAGIETLLGDDGMRATMGRNARRLAGEAFSISAVAGELVNIYAHAIGTGSSR
jgi:glycosyltransferase involved in cell wall biosynthesis